MAVKCNRGMGLFRRRRERVGEAKPRRPLGAKVFAAAAVGLIGFVLRSEFDGEPARPRAGWIGGGIGASLKTPGPGTGRLPWSCEKSCATDHFSQLPAGPAL